MYLSDGINYVKFVRGSESAWEKVQAPDRNTLYFISNKDSKTGRLYLGDILLCSGDLEGEQFAFENISDVLLSKDIQNNSILIYDGANKKWTNQSLSTIISLMKGSTAVDDGKGGIVPAPQKGEQNFYLRGDGKWANPNSDFQDQIDELIGEDKGKSIRDIIIENIQENTECTIYWGNF